MLALSLELARHHRDASLASLPAPGAVLTGLLALVAVLLQEFWVLTRHVSVIAHEGAHALVGGGMGNKVVGMRVSGDGTGLTVTQGGRGRVTSGFAGYLGPSAFGLGAAKLIQLGDIGAVLWLALILLAVALISVRNFFGIVSLVITGGLLFLVVRDGGAGLQTAVAYTLTWFLLLSGVRYVVNHGPRAGDAANLRDLTYVPRVVWFGLWLVGTIAALMVGGRLLV